MRARVAALVVVLPLLAGCAGQPGPSAPTAARADTPLPPELDHSVKGDTHVYAFPADAPLHNEVRRWRLVADQDLKVEATWRVEAAGPTEQEDCVMWRMGWKVGPEEQTGFLAMIARGHGRQDIHVRALGREFEHNTTEVAVPLGGLFATTNLDARVERRAVLSIDVGGSRQFAERHELVMHVTGSHHWERVPPASLRCGSGVDQAQDSSLIASGPYGLGTRQGGSIPFESDNGTTFVAFAAISASDLDVDVVGQRQAVDGFMFLPEPAAGRSSIDVGLWWPTDRFAWLFVADAWPPLG